MRHNGKVWGILLYGIMVVLMITPHLAWASNQEKMSNICQTFYHNKQIVTGYISFENKNVATVDIEIQGELSIKSHSFSGEIFAKSPISLDRLSIGTITITENTFEVEWHGKLEEGLIPIDKDTNTLMGSADGLTQGFNWGEVDRIFQIEDQVDFQWKWWVKYPSRVFRGVFVGMVFQGENESLEIIVSPKGKPLGFAYNFHDENGSIEWELYFN